MREIPHGQPRPGSRGFLAYHQLDMKDNKFSPSEESAKAQARCGRNPAHRILVVDDELGIRQVSAAVLGCSGYDVDTAEDGEAGWNALQTKNYDLLITDNNMPKLTGVEL